MNIFAYISIGLICLSFVAFIIETFINEDDGSRHYYYVALAFFFLLLSKV